jgi:hypothetical protein
MPPKASDAAPAALAPKDEVAPASTRSRSCPSAPYQNPPSSRPAQFELLVKLTVSIRCVPIAPPPEPADQPPAGAAPEDISPAAVKFKLSLLGVSLPVESPAAAARDFTWEAPVELVSSEAWAQQMAVDEESHVAVRAM